MRVYAACAVAVLCVAACGAPPRPAAPGTAASLPMPAAAVDPARIERVRYDLPPGYEVADLSGRAAPLALWGLGPNWTADPSDCGVLGDPLVDPASVRGWAGSGAGGIVYAVVADGAAAQDPALADQCEHWTVAAGRTTGSVTLVDAPAVPDATTVGMSSAVMTTVEGGNQTRSHADTFVAYLGDHVAFITVVTDPGSPNPPLDAGFAAGLLVKAVSALRG